jgi:hypothetical protein
LTTDLERRLEDAGALLQMPDETELRRIREHALAALPEARAVTRPRPTRALRLAAAATVALAVVGVALLADGLRGPGPFTTEKAVAALGEGPVLHAVAELELPWATIVDLESGEERAQFQQTEFWYDAEQGRLRARVTVDGTVVSELVQARDGSTTPRGPLDPPSQPRLDPALAGFATRYREALESGTAQVVGRTSVDGRDVVRLELSAESPDPARTVREQIDVDADTFRPLRFRYLLDGVPAPWWRVISIETDGRRPGQFDAAPEQVRPQAQTGSGEQELTPAQAAGALGRPVLWPGVEVDGVELSTIELVKLTTLWTDGHETEGQALRLAYGGGKLDRAPRWLEIRQGTVRAERPRIGPDDPNAVPPGSLQLFGRGGLDGSDVDWWAAYLDVDGVFLTLESNERELILEAARSLVPIG